MSSLARKIEVEELIEDLSTDDRLLQLDAFLIHSPQINCPLDHIFYPKLYIRERFVPAGVLFTTYTWKIEHPFELIFGELLIWQDGQGWQHLTAPANGRTLAGTKRIVYTISDVCWKTYHYNETNTQDIEILEDALLEKYSNPYVSLEELKALK